MSEDWKYCIALSMVSGIGGVFTKNLFNKFQNPVDIFKAPKKELLKVEGIGDKHIESIKNFDNWDKVDQELEKIEKRGIKLLTLNDSEFPRLLLQTYNPPPLLYMKGEILPEDNISIAIVGSRIPDRYGRSITETLSGELAFALQPLDDMGDSLIIKPFDIAIDVDGNAWVTGNESHSVIAFDTDGNLIRSVTGMEASGAGIISPMGVASDSLGNIWVSNSGIVRAPCDGTDPPTWIQVLELSLAAGFSGENASVTLINADGDPVGPFKGGGLLIPWGIAVDGNDNVWVANFQGRAVSQICGAAPENCPPGFQTGDPISPDGGYFFDGLVRNTGVQIDPSGNVWLANNWEIIADPENPGGHEMVVFIGLAKPVQAPLIGPPQK